MESKSRWRVFVGYNNESKSIKYYNVETCKILTSQNFCFLSLTSNDTPPEPMVIIPDVPGEGDFKGSMQLKSGNNCNSLKWKWSKEEEPQEKWHTRGICMNYQYLQNSFPDEEDNVNEVAFEHLYAIIVRGQPLNRIPIPFLCLYYFTSVVDSFLHSLLLHYSSHTYLLLFAYSLISDSWQ
jgi:hypothetical protein